MDPATAASRGNRLLRPLIFGWGAFAALGVVLLTAYGNAPGDSSDPAELWPTKSSLVPSTAVPTLLVFVHPRCGCSRATIGELAVLAAQCRGRFDCRVLFARPVGFEPGWEQAALWDLAAEIPDVQLVVDEDEREAEHFDVATSGHALLYGVDGRLLFSGGLTAARGHSGDNVGRSAVTAILQSRVTSTAAAPVYGCPLFSPNTRVESFESCPQ